MTTEELEQMKERVKTGEELVRTVTKLDDCIFKLTGKRSDLSIEYRDENSDTVRINPYKSGVRNDIFHSVMDVKILEGLRELQGYYLNEFSKL